MILSSILKQNSFKTKTSVAAMIGNTKYISHSDGLETLASRENQSESEFLASILKYASRLEVQALLQYIDVLTRHPVAIVFSDAIAVHNNFIDFSDLKMLTFAFQTIY